MGIKDHVVFFHTNCEWTIHVNCAALARSVLENEETARDMECLIVMLERITKDSGDAMKRTTSCK